MPVDESKVLDLLKNQHIFRNKIHDEITTFRKGEENTQFENGVLQYLSNAAHGEMQDLIREVGINRDTIQFTSVNDWVEAHGKLMYPSDRMIPFLQNAMFTPLDMTDYEEDYVGWEQWPGFLPLQNTGKMQMIEREPFPQIDALAAIETPENPPVYGTSQTMLETIKDFYYPGEAEEIDFYGKEGGDDDYGDDYGEEGEEGGDDGDYGDEAEEEVWPPPETEQPSHMEDRFFRDGETLRGQYSEVELDAFMKLLSVRPRSQWQDTSLHHWRLGLHAYEDQNQELDPDFHILSEQERKWADRGETEKWRSGSEVKFVVGGRKPVTPNYRF